LLSLVFFISVSTSTGTKKGRIYIRGAPQIFGEAVAPNLTPTGSATGLISMSQKHF